MSAEAADAPRDWAVSCGEILVVDDNTANLVAVEAALGNLRARVVRARSGPEALRLMLDHDFALILLDVNMPSMGGFETARLIRSRKRSSHTPIIFITAYDRDDSDVLAAYELGAVDFLFKPIVPSVLYAKASVFVELGQRTAEVAQQAEQIREHASREHARLLEEERHRWQEQALRREMEQLADADRRKDYFLATLAHELRTPLTPIVTGLALLREKLRDNATIDPAVFRARDTMERQVKHLTCLVDDLLDISRISAGKIELRETLLDAREVVTQAVATCRPLLDQGKRQLTVELPDTPLAVRGDEVRLTQVIANLLANAARYTHEHGEIGVRAAAVDDCVEVRVSDDGRGISPEFLSRIFDSFAQETPSIGGGLGLGLSLVSRLTALHAGSVTAYSAGLGKGSEFVLRLPLRHGAVPQTEGTVRPPPRTQASARRIVLVEDNDDIRDMLGTLLTLWGHEVFFASDGERGAELVIELEPDVALIDVGLPLLDGYGVAARVREQLGAQSVRLVAMTGFGQEADQLRARAVGFDVHLVKPVEADALRQVLSFEEHDAIS